MVPKSSLRPTAAAALAAFLLVSSTLLLPTQAACKPGKTPEHCKPRGAACTLRKVSECEDPYKCDKVSRTCTDASGGGQPDPTPKTPVPTPDTGSCVLPVSPFRVNTGTPADHLMRHPGDPNYKNIAAVDMFTASARQEVYAVESGKLSKGGSFAISSGAPSKWGWSFEILTPNKGNFFYTHVADPLAKNPATGKPWDAGEQVQKGQLLGWVAQPPAPPPGERDHAIHLHFAYSRGNPCDYLRGCKGINGAGPDATLSKC